MARATERLRFLWAFIRTVFGLLTQALSGKKLPLYLFKSLIHSLFTGIRNKGNEFKIHTKQVPRAGDQIDIC